MGYPIQAIHVPKTVDNDLPITDNCPGFGSVAKYIAVSTREASFDVASMCKTSTKVFVLEVMGRHAGWIAAAGGLAADEDCDLPIVILFPEVAFNQAKFLAKVKDMVKKYGYCSVVVSEGVHDRRRQVPRRPGSPGCVRPCPARRRRPGHRQYGPRRLGLKYHWAVADYLQRAARHIASKSDVDQAYAMGKAAVELALAGKNSVMPTVVRVSNKPYQWKIGVADLANVANVEKMMPRNFITKDGFGITDACRTYLQPLIQGEDYPPYKNGMPQYVQLKNVAVAKKLKSKYELKK